jgi:hypothetical protein
VAVHLQPRPKEPHFFSLATPVEVTGHLTDFKVGVSAASVLATVARFATSIVTTPFEMLVAHRLPRDGADVCGEPAPAAR